MTSLKGTYVLAPIVPPDDTRTFPTHVAEYGKGGLHSVITLAERDLISEERRTEGMLCFVKDVGRTFQLKGGILNTNWQELSTGSGSGGGNGDMSQYVYDSDSDGKVNAAEVADIALKANSVEWNNISGKPTAIAPTAHGHLASEITTDSNRQFVNQVQIDKWNSKADTANIYTKTETDAKFANLIGTVPSVLDTIQEINNAINNDPNYATTVSTALANKVDKISGKGLSTNDFTDAEKTKLAGLTNYVPPSSYPASMIQTDMNHEFVTDAQIAAWNAKQNALGFTPEDSAKKGAINGYASLDGTGKVPVSQLPNLGFNTGSVVPDSAARSGITGMKTGDLCYETSTGDTYIYDGASWKLMADKDWQNLNIDWSVLTGKPTSSVSAIDNAVLNSHAHSNKVALDGTTESFTTALKNKIGDADTLKGLPIDLTGATNGYSFIYSNGSVKLAPIVGGGGGTGSGDMTTVVYDTNGNGIVDRAEVADSVSWANITEKPGTFPILAHKSSHAIGGTDILTPADIGAADASVVSTHVSNMSNPHNTTKAQIGLNNLTNDAQVKRTEMGANNGVATLDGTGKVPLSQLPALAVNNTYVVSSESAMLGLTAVQGDVAIRTDLSKSYILQVYPASTLSNWQELLAPTGVGITSVNGQTGSVITLTTTNVSEGTNLYFTDARVASNPTVQGHITNYSNPHNTTKAQVGLSNLTNDAQVKRTEMGTANGVATLDATGLIPASQLPAGAGGNAPVTSVNSKVGSVVLTTSDIVESTNLYYTDVRVDARILANPAVSSISSHISNTSNPHNVTKTQIGLSSVTNDAQVKRIEMAAPNGVATLDGSGKVLASQLPATVINNTYVVANQAGMTALAANIGDIAIRTDLSKSFVLSASPASLVSNWIELLAPTGSGIQTINSKTGSNVTLTTSDIVEGTNLYYTDARVAAAPALTNHINNTSNPHNVTKTQVGLSNVDNIQQIPMSQKGVSNGVATLGVDGKVPASQLPAVTGGSTGGSSYTRYQAGTDCWVVASQPGVVITKAGTKFTVTANPNNADIRTVQAFCNKTEIGTGLTMTFDIYPNSTGLFSDFRMPIIGGYFTSGSTLIMKTLSAVIDADAHTINAKALQTGVDHWVILEF